MATKKTYYTKNNDTNSAYVKLLSATPSDTTIAIWPNNGTYHEITWPAAGSKSNESVQLFDDATGEMKKDEYYQDYWVKAGKEAWQNREPDKEKWYKRAAKSILGNSELVSALGNLSQARISNPGGLMLKDNKLSPEQKKQLLKEFNAATSLGMTLPLVGSGIGAPYVMPYIVGSMGVTALSSQMNRKKDKSEDVQKKAKGGITLFKDDNTQKNYSTRVDIKKFYTPIEYPVDIRTWNELSEEEQLDKIKSVPEPVMEFYRGFDMKKALAAKRYNNSKGYQTFENRTGKQILEDRKKQQLFDIQKFFMELENK